MYVIKGRSTVLNLMHLEMHDTMTKKGIRKHNCLGIKKE